MFLSICTWDNWHIELYVKSAQLIDVLLVEQGQNTANNNKNKENHRKRNGISWIGWSESRDTRSYLRVACACGRFLRTSLRRQTFRGECWQSLCFFVRYAGEKCSLAYFAPGALHRAIDVGYRASRQPADSPSRRSVEGPEHGNCVGTVLPSPGTCSACVVWYEWMRETSAAGHCYAASSGRRPSISYTISVPRSGPIRTTATPARRFLRPLLAAGRAENRTRGCG